MGQQNIDWGLQELSFYQRRHLASKLSKLAPDDAVKLWFVGSDGYNEHMWVRITHRVGHQFVGTVANDPRIESLKFGDLVLFEERHIEKLEDG